MASRLLTRPMPYCVPSLATLLLLAGTALGQQDAVQSAPPDRAPVRAPSPKRVAALRTNPASDGQHWPAAAVVQWPELDTTALVLEDNLRDPLPATPMRVGVLRKVEGDNLITALRNGQWSILPDGTRIWTLQIVSPGAIALRVHFSEFELPEGTTLTVAAESGVAEKSYSGRGPLGDGSFWSIDTRGKVVFLEYVDATRGGVQPVIEIDEISHQYREGPPSEALGVPRGGLQPCQQDVNCHSPDLIARDSVGQMTYTISGQGTFVCTGAILNDNDPNTFAGYFLTANHCLSTQAAVNTLVVRWFYQTVSCNGAVSNGVTTTGGTLLTTSTTSDFTFLRLADDPELGQGFAPWTTTSVPFSGATVRGIHHPGGSWKRYSAGTTTAGQPTCTSQSQYIYLDFTTGIVEGGSSGSPLFNASWQVVGSLTGVCFFVGTTPGCSNHSEYNTYYGRFSNQFNIVAGPSNQSMNTHLNTITPDDEYEDNDNFASAAPLSFGVHPLRLVDFDDFFRLEVCGPGTLTVTATFSTTDIDLDMELLDTNQFVIDSSSSAGGTETVSVEANTGEYVVRNIKDRRWGGNYTLNVAFDPVFDCNNNQLDDACELAPGVNDCNFDGILDACQAIPDCNSNGLIDVCDINRGNSVDCDLNGVPDECESPDCPAALAASSMNSGGTASSGPTRMVGSVYSLVASTSQSGGVGRLESEDYILRDGFWYSEMDCTPRVYADIAPWPVPDGLVELADVLCGLAGYSNLEDCAQGDIAPCFGDDLIELSDILALLSAYSGDYLCEGPCVE